MCNVSRVDMLAAMFMLVLVLFKEHILYLNVWDHRYPTPCFSIERKSSVNYRTYVVMFNVICRMLFSFSALINDNQLFRQWTRNRSMPHIDYFTVPLEGTDTGSIREHVKTVHCEIISIIRSKSMLIHICTTYTNVTCRVYCSYIWRLLVELTNIFSCIQRNSSTNSSIWSVLCTSRSWNVYSTAELQFQCDFDDLSGVNNNVNCRLLPFR
jgi:hypothetical protein